MERPAPIDEQYTFLDGVVISETDLKGIITFSNRKFCEISGYTKSELLGENHSILRHPDIPKAVYKNLWDTIQKGEIWTGTIKNIRKDGRYYWVYSHISAVRKGDKIVGYIAARKQASPMEIEEAEEAYEKSLQEEN